MSWANDFKSRLNNALDMDSMAGATALNLLSKFRDKFDQWWYFQGYQRRL